MWVLNLSLRKMNGMGGAFDDEDVKDDEDDEDAGVQW